MGTFKLPQAAAQACFLLCSFLQRLASEQTHVFLPHLSPLQSSHLLLVSTTLQTMHSVALANTKDPEKTLHQVIHYNLTSLGSSKTSQLANVIFQVIAENPIQSLDKESRPYACNGANMEDYGIYIPKLNKNVTKEDLLLSLKDISHVVNCQVDHFSTQRGPHISCGYAYFRNSQEMEKVLQKSSMALFKIQGETVKCVSLKGTRHEHIPNKSIFPLFLTHKKCCDIARTPSQNIRKAPTPFNPSTKMKTKKRMINMVTILLLFMVLNLYGLSNPLFSMKCYIYPKTSQKTIKNKRKLLR